MEKKNFNKSKKQTKTMTSTEVRKDALYILNTIRFDFHDKAILSLALTKQFYFDKSSDTIKFAEVPVIYIRPRDGYNNVSWRALYKYYLTRELVEVYQYHFGTKLRTEDYYSIDSVINDRPCDIQYFNGDELVFVVRYDETFSKTLIGIENMPFEVRVDRKKRHVYHIGSFGFIKTYLDKDGKVFRMKGCFSLNFDESRIVKKTSYLRFKNIDAKRHHYMRYIQWQRT